MHRYRSPIRRLRNPDEFEIETPMPPEEKEVKDRHKKSMGLFHAAAEVDILVMNLRLYIKHSRKGLAQDAELVERVAKLEQASQTAYEAAKQAFEDASEAAKKLKAKKASEASDLHSLKRRLR